MGRLALGERPGVQWGSTRRAFTSSLQRQALSREMMRSENSRSPHASEEAEKPASRCDKAQVRAMGKAGGGATHPKVKLGQDSEPRKDPRRQSSSWSGSGSSQGDDGVTPWHPTVGWEGLRLPGWGVERAQLALVNRAGLPKLLRAKLVGREGPPGAPPGAGGVGAFS